MPWEHSTLHSSIHVLEAPESDDESDPSNGDDDVSWRSMRREVKMQSEEIIKATFANEADECLDENPHDAAERQQQSSLSFCEKALGLLENGNNRSSTEEVREMNSNDKVAAASTSVSSQQKPLQPESHDDKDNEMS